MSKNEKYYIGIDLGGTFIKGGIVTEDGKILVSDKTPTQVESGADGVARNIASLALSLLESAKLSLDDVEGLGIGSPGMIDSASGVVVYANNLGWSNFDVCGRLSDLLGKIKVKIGNDANVAALGEQRFGAARRYGSIVMITLGTGVGGGVIIDGKILEGNRGAGAELGHAVIVKDGEPCSCGRRGCLEAYSSATALIRDTKRAMHAHPESRMWETYTLEDVSGKTVFDYADTDETAAGVLNSYLEHLACGLVNYANIFRPEAIIIGGGVCAQRERLTRPLQELFDRELYAPGIGPEVPIIVAELENSAGLLGAAALLMD